MDGSRLGNCLGVAPRIHVKIKSFRLFWFRSRSFPDYWAAGESDDRAFPQVFIYLRSEQNGTAPGQAWCHRGSITGPSWHLPVTESVVLPPDQRRSIMIILQPPCPACQTTTMLARITPGPAGFDIRTFECPACDHVHQCVVELIDPMKSKETAGWLAGELGSDRYA